MFGGFFANSQSISPFNPLDYSPLLWVDARVGVIESGGLVSSWEDQSGNGNNLTQVDGFSQPTYTLVNSDFNGMPTVDFNGSSNYLKNDLLSSSIIDSTFIVVYRVNSIPENGSTLISTEGTNNKRLFYGVSSLANGVIRNSTGSRNIPTPISTTYIVTYQFDGTTLRYKVNNNSTAVISNFSSPSNTSKLSIGYSLGLSGRWLNCDIAELLVFPTVLSTQEIDDTTTYLNNIYTVY